MTERCPCCGELGPHLGEQYGQCEYWKVVKERDEARKVYEDTMLYLDIDSLNADRKHLREQVKDLREALSFAKSCIQSGEEWTEDCEKIFTGAMR